MGNNIERNIFIYFQMKSVLRQPIDLSMCDYISVSFFLFRSLSNIHILKIYSKQEEKNFSIFFW